MILARIVIVCVIVVIVPYAIAARLIRETRSAWWLAYLDVRQEIRCAREAWRDPKGPGIDI